MKSTVIVSGKKKTMKAEKSDLNKTEIMRKILRRDA